MSLIIPTGLFTGEVITNRPIFSNSAEVKCLAYTPNSTYLYGAFSTVDNYNRRNFVELDSYFNVKSGTCSPIINALAINLNADFESNNDIITMDNYSIIRMDRNGNRLSDYVFPAFSGATGSIAIRRKPTGSTNYLYFAGSFSMSTKSRMVALSLSGNLYSIVTGFNIFNTSIDIYGIADYLISGTDKLLVYGQYSTSGNYNGISLISATTGARDASFSSQILSGRVTDVSMSSASDPLLSTIMICGNFTANGGQSYIIAVNGEGTYQTYFTKYTLNRPVYKINVQFSGAFPDIIYAAVSTTSAILGPHTLYKLTYEGEVSGGFTPAETDGIIESVIYDSISQTILITGNFFNVNGLPRNQFARLDRFGNLL